MVLKKRYYKVTFDGGKEVHEVYSLPKAKKLIQGRSDWRVTLFKSNGKNIGSIQTLGITWSRHYENLCGKKWKAMTQFDKFAYSLYKSRIAK